VTAFARGTTFIGLLLLAATAAHADWPPVSPAELAMGAPTLEPGAAAEALLWDVRVAHEVEGGWLRTEFSHHLRIKVFSEGGRDRLGTVDIPFADGESVSDISGRTIRPDGSIVELDKASIYERTVVKTGGVEVKAKSFALPGLQVGSIIEYRWKQTLDDRITNYFRLQFQREIPIHLVRYHVKPIQLPEFPYGMHNLTVHLRSGAFAREGDGFYMVSAENIPAFKPEPDMPPEASVRAWMLIYYAPDVSEPPEKYWPTVGKSIYEGYHGAIKLNDEMRAAAAEAVKGVQADEERLRKLLDYVTTGFKNSADDVGEGGRDARDKVKENKSTLDTWRQKAGSGYEITLLFLALSEALGYEARLAEGSVRDFGPFDQKFTNPYFLRTYCAAVKVGGSWMFCDPASRGLPFGMLRWNEQGQGALVSDPRQPQLVVTPVAPPETSLTERHGKFRLSAGGDLEGDVRLSYTGEAAFDRKWRYRRESAAEREESVREGLKERFGAAEATDISIAGMSGSEPLTVTYKAKIPGYAQRSERRLFLPCAFFTKGYAPRYSASSRTLPVAYPHAWSEHDSVVYELPKGYALENPSAPHPFTITGVGEYNAKVGVSTDGRLLVYERTFDFGRGGLLLFPPASYPAIKQSFDQLQEGDNHTLILRQVAP
jgi:hypothetical protein